LWEGLAERPVPGFPERSVELGVRAEDCESGMAACSNRGVAGSRQKEAGVGRFSSGKKK